MPVGLRCYVNPIRCIYLHLYLAPLPVTRLAIAFFGYLRSRLVITVTRFGLHWLRGLPITLIYYRLDVGTHPGYPRSRLTFPITVGHVVADVVDSPLPRLRLVTVEPTFVGFPDVVTLCHHVLLLRRCTVVVDLRTFTLYTRPVATLPTV